MIVDILEKSKIEKNIIGIRLYGDEDGFLSGYVKDYTDELVILQHFTRYGKPDGLMVEKLENIASIDFDDDYSRAMEYLIKNTSTLDADEEIELIISNPEEWQFEILENLIGDKEKVAAVQINNQNSYSGFVEWCNYEHLVLNILGKEGQDEGKTLFKVEDITSISINDIDDRKKLLLYKWRYTI